MSETKKPISVSDAIKKARENATPKAEENTTVPDWQKLYTEECAKNKVLENKVAEFEKLCKSYSERERQATEALQRATLEYNARAQYMLDAARHAYMSMQFAANAASRQPQGGNQ